MKLLHVTPYMDPVYGGPSVAVRMMAAVAVAQGVEVHVAVTNAAGFEDLRIADGASVEEDGVIFHYFQRRFPRSWFRAPSMKPWLDAHITEFDLLHLHVPFTAPFGIAAQAAQRAGRPYVVTLHGLLDPWSLRQKAWKKRPYLRFIERDNLARATRLHVTAPLEAGYVEALNLGPRVCSLPLAVDCGGATFPDKSRAQPSRVLCIARLHPVKALPVLFRALEKLRKDGLDVVLDIAGNGDAEYVSELKKLVRELDLEPYVVWHGYVNAEQRRLLFAQAHLFALLSFHENFGLAAAEALAAGLPVVVSDQVGLASDVKTYTAGEVVPVGNPERAAQAIAKLLDPLVAAQRGRCARKLALERYGADAFAEGLMSLYRDALGY